MKNKIIITISIILLVTIVVLTYKIVLKKSDNHSVIVEETGDVAEYSKKDITTDYDETKVTYIYFEGDKIKTENSTAKIENETITLVSSGDYYVTGTLDNGSIIVDAQDSDDVHIIFDNVDITNFSFAPIYVKNADKVIITLAENSINTITDGELYTNLIEEEPDGAIFSHDDLTINGNGTLHITANYKDAIAVKDDLVILSSTLYINANDDGIRGKDSVTIKDANITITAKGDGIKTTNDTDEGKGLIVIDSGNFNIITTSSSVSSKGIKATSNVTIHSGTFTIHSIDDSIHSNGDVVINNGNFTLTTEDDGIHADENVVINNGNIIVKDSYEGIEGLNVSINAGEIDITSTDDGINGAGGADASGMSRGGDRYSNAGASIVINDGEINIKSSTSGTGDAIDSNGSITFTGGTVTITSPSVIRDYSSIDCETDITMEGGNLYIDGKLYTSSNIEELGQMQHGGMPSGGAKRGR